MTHEELEVYTTEGVDILFCHRVIFNGSTISFVKEITVVVINFMVTPIMIVGKTIPKKGYFKVIQKNGLSSFYPEYISIDEKGVINTVDADFLEDVFRL